MPITKRTARLKERCRWKNTTGGEYSDKRTRVGIERARYITEAHKNTPGEPEVIRRARMLENVLLKTTVFIQEDELIVGNNAEHPDYFPAYPDFSYFVSLEFAESPYCDHKEELRDIVEYWRPYGLQGKCERYFTEEELGILYSTTITEPPPFVTGASSCVPPYETVLEDGLNGRIKMIEAQLAEANARLREDPWIAKDNLPSLEKIDMWTGMMIACKAVIAWARRYSRLARIIAENFETDPGRQEELMKISEICWRIPAEPAKGFWDAIQSKWFVYLLCHAYERLAAGYAHKEDSLLWPYYENSVIKKTHQPMTREEAQELVECERLKVSEHGIPAARVHREVLPGANNLFIITLGGLNADGSDGCNECTDVILDAAASIMTAEPSLGFRWNSKGREETKKRVFNCIKQGLGFPSIKNDEAGISQLVGYGASLEQARSWALVLCMSPGVTGRRGSQKTRLEGGGEVRLIKCFEIALSDGFDHAFSQIQLGPHTGDPTKFENFEDVWEAFRKQTRNALMLAFRGKDITRQVKIKHLPFPFLSAIDDGCVEEGKDAMELVEIPNQWQNTVGNISTVNSLAAIKKLVFDEKKYTLEQLITAIRANWEGYEEMRLDCWNAPKWGNDDDYCDDIAKKYYDLLAEEWGRVKTYSGASPKPLGESVGTYVYMGPRTGATPDGRKHGEVIDDGGISPYMGTDKKGPTAVLKSVSKIDPRKHKGNLLNQRLSQQIMNSEAGYDLWRSYMKTWHELDIDHVQFNVVSDKEMRSAQKDPEKHEDLIVRIAGYSARFVNLPTYFQDSIIARTEQQLGA